MSSPINPNTIAKQPMFERFLTYLGESKNGAVIVTCAIAAFKGVFRPLFTMMDKKSDPETKKYAAIREGLTELVALPIYAATPFLIDKFVIEKIFKNEAKERQILLKGNAKFLTVCAATLIIPAVCNLIQPPIMKAYKKRQEEKKTKLDITSEAPTPSPVAINKPATQINSPTQVSNPTAKMNFGMKVGN